MRTWLAVVLTLLYVAANMGAEPAAAGPREWTLPSSSIEATSWSRINRYAIWQNYGVDRHGYFRPRVIYTPEGAFYYYEGRPYPYVSIHPLNFMPYAGD